MSEVAEIVQYRENNNLSGQATVFNYLVKIATAIDENRLDFSDEEFLDYILAIDCELDYKEIFDLDNVPEFADIPSEAYKRYVSGMKEFKFTVISSQLMYYFHHDQFIDAEEFFYDIQDELEDYPFSENSDGGGEKEIKGTDSTKAAQPDQYEDQDFPLYPYFRARIALENLYNTNHPDIAEIIELSNKSRRNCDQHYLILTNFARSVARAYEDNPEQELKIERFPSERDQVLREASEAIDVATTIVDQYAPAFAIKARVYALRGDFGSKEHKPAYFKRATEAIQKAIELEDTSIESYSEHRQEYSRIQRDIKLRQRTSSLAQEVSDAHNSLDEVNRQLNNTVQRYRKNTLSFIGFFTALITLAVTSTQILSGTSGSLEGKATLVIVEAGALIFAFGAFGLLLPSMSDEDNHRNRAVYVIGLGAVILSATITLLFLHYYPA